MLNNNNNHNNGSCDFSETLVSYLYGEIGAAESDKFKAHLAHCGHCAEELAGFGAMRSSLAEWKQEEFSPMSAPVIELGARTVHPYERAHERDAFELPESKPVFVAASSSWLDAIREFFTPKVALTAAGFAVVVICVGLTFAFFNFGNSNNELAINKQQKTDVKPVINVENEKPLTEKKDDVAKITAPAPKNNDNDSAVKSHEKLQKPVREIVGYQPKNNVAVNTNNKHQDAPKQIKPETRTLTADIYDDTEDESLRLADLFAEADTN